MLPGVLVMCVFGSVTLEVTTVLSRVLRGHRPLGAQGGGCTSWTPPRRGPALQVGDSTVVTTRRQRRSVSIDCSREQRKPVATTKRSNTHTRLQSSSCEIPYGRATFSYLPLAPYGLCVSATCILCCVSSHAGEPMPSPILTWWYAFRDVPVKSNARGANADGDDDP